MIDTRTMEKTRDLLAEIGAVNDRFHEAGLAAFSIMEVLAAESEIWLARVNREEHEAEVAARERAE